jgi:pilus assembly protein CpaD
MTLRATSVLIAFAFSGLLAGCASGPLNGPHHVLSAAERHPITVHRENAEMEITVTPGMGGLAHDTKARVVAFAREFRARGHGVLTVAAPSGSPNARAAASIMPEIHQALADAGFTRADYQSRSYRADEADTNAPVILSFTRYRAEASPCGDWSRNAAISWNNMPMANLGCATQHNLAAMVAEPRDLLTPRTMDPADAARRAIVLEKYRQGQPTATERGEDESGIVSRAVR